MGHPAAIRPGFCDLRLVRRAGQLCLGRLERRRAARRPVAGRFSRDRQGHPRAAPRRLLADHAACGGHRSAQIAAGPRLVAAERRPENVEEHGRGG